MLQFISSLTSQITCAHGFNTSHVVVYPEEPENAKLESALFQYISCCSLSICFQPLHKLVSRFQYISCCSLSYRMAPHRRPLQQFQYISCCSLSNYCQQYLLNKDVSIHLMLQFINHIHRYFRFPMFVSIHLMLQFIEFYLCIASNHFCFNTSHVVVYRRLAVCQCLLFLSFNTSHVVVYLQHSTSRPDKIQFQYISCCSLSNFRKKWAVTISQFQYISCCSLSLNPSFTPPINLCFNTSHVVVYHETGHNMKGWLIIVSIHLMLQFISGFFCRTTSKDISFNTSHVVVYPFSPAHKPHKISVSIHLMLQFI